jgi:hypothetical protein
MNGWPDKDKPGFPVDPETDGWHWLSNSMDMPCPWRWFSKERTWGHVAQDDLPAEFMSKAKYLGPALTPAEVADVVEAIGEAAAEAMTAMLNGFTQDSDGETKH